MLSESARATTSAELRFRLQSPNSIGRATAVVALDPAGELVVRRLAGDRWQRATFLRAPAADEPRAEDGWVSTLDDRPTRIRDAVDAADHVIMVAGAGGHAGGAAVIGRACSRSRVTTTALIVGTAAASDDELSQTLAQVRPWSLMVVIANSDEYVADMMTALRV